MSTTLFTCSKDELKEIISEIFRETLNNQNNLQKSDDLVLTSEEACEYLQIGKTSLHFLVKEGEINCFKKKRKRYFLKSDLNSYLGINDNCKTNGGN